MLGTPLRDNFELIAGTSTGAIIALGVALDIELGKIVDLFELHGGKIFPRHVRRRSEWILSWLFKGPRYDQEPLNNVLTDVFKRDGKQLQLSDCRPPVLIAAATLDRYGIRAFNTLQPEAPDSRDGELFASDVALASAAAPSFFPPFRPRGRTKTQQIRTEQRTYVDGGIWANNPVLLAVLQTSRQLSIPFDEMRVVSIGNGERPSGSVAVDFNNMRRARMLKPIMDMMFSTQSELADVATAHLLGDVDMTGNRMLRINAHLEKDIDLDDVDEAIRRLKPLAEREARNGFAKFQQIIRP